MSKRPFYFNNPHPKRYCSPPLAPVTIGSIFTPGTSMETNARRGRQNRGGLHKPNSSSAPSMISLRSASPTKTLPGPSRGVNSAESNKKKKATELEYPSNDLLSLPIPIMDDPLHDIFDRISIPRQLAPLIDLENEEEEEGEFLDMSEMVESVRMEPPHPLDDSDLVTIDCDSTLKDLESDDDDIICVGESSGYIERRSRCSGTVSSPISSPDTVSLPTAASDTVPSQIVNEVVLEDEEEDVTILEDESKIVVRQTRKIETSVRVQSIDDEDEPAITSEKLLNAAFEDSLVKGTCQDYGVLVRHWELVKKLHHLPNVKDNVIRVCTYNILCQETIGRTGYLYRHLLGTPNQHFLQWENRWRLLEQNLEHIDADIFGLQEVQDTHFTQYINPLMTSRGYNVMWTPKTKVPTLSSKDGCALFWRRSTFDYVFSKQVEYYCGNGMCMDRPQIGQILRLKEKKTNKQIVVANTHILFNMKRGDIKLGQLAMLLANIHQEMKDHGDAPLILMGDFNMEKYSHLYTFLTKGSLFLKGLPRSCLASKDNSNTPTVDLDEILPPKIGIGRDSKFIPKNTQRSNVRSDTITHPFNLWTAQATLMGRTPGEEVSTLHMDAGNPDFIFYTVKAKEFITGTKHVVHETPFLRLHRRVTLPTAKQCMETLGPWPNKHVPSDHIPLIVEFQIRGDPVTR